MQTASFVILVYAGILVIGGFIGWRLSGSRMSFTSSLISAALLSVAYRLSRIAPRPGYLLGTAICLGLAAMFGVRLKKTGKFVPSGILLLLSAAVAITLAWSAIAG
jgi:uncharacterized membrane protein (UPF0136 family)